MLSKAICSHSATITMSITFVFSFKHVDISEGITEMLRHVQSLCRGNNE
jgi:hypothetical protein